MKEYILKIKSLAEKIYWPWVFVGLGIFLRIYHYISNRSFWLDESMLILNILKKPLLGLFGPLEYQQTAPIGFLLISKVFVSLFGPSEYALRLLPFLSAIASVFIFYKVAKLYLEEKGVVWATALFAVSGWLIYYATEAKQYSCDVFATVIMLYVAYDFINGRKQDILSFIRLGVVGAIIVWFSHPSIFILAGIGCVLGFNEIRARNIKGVMRLFIPALFWLISFFSIYSMRKNNMGYETQAFYKSYWYDTFFKIVYKDIWEFLDTLRNLLITFKNPYGFYFQGFAAFLFFVGCCSFSSSDRKHFFLLILPVLFAIAASLSFIYPFSDRLALFSLPLVILFIAKGLASLEASKVSSKAVVIISAAILFMHPALSNAYHLIRPITREEIKPMIEYFNRQHRQGDKLYLTHFAQPAFAYYKDRAAVEDDDIIYGLKTYMDDIGEIVDNDRVWVLVTHPRNSGVLDLDRQLLEILDEKGERLAADSFTGVWMFMYETPSVASIYLYDFKRRDALIQ